MEVRSWKLLEIQKINIKNYAKSLRSTVTCDTIESNREAAASGKGESKVTTGKQVVVIVEVGEEYIDQLHTMEVDQCSMEEAQEIARDLGYRVIGELCAIVDTIDETHIIVTVEPEEEEEEEITWEEKE